MKKTLFDMIRLVLCPPPTRHSHPHSATTACVQIGAGHCARTTNAEPILSGNFPGQKKNAFRCLHSFFQTFLWQTITLLITCWTRDYIIGIGLDKNFEKKSELLERLAQMSSYTNHFRGNIARCRDLFSVPVSLTLLLYKIKQLNRFAN